MATVAAEAPKSTRIVALRSKALALLEKAKDVPLLLLRLNMGVLFASTGWGKVHNVEKVTAFFTELKIPAPHFHAILVGWTELLGGIALIVGLGSRLAAIPLAISMMVAILTAKASSIHGLADLATTDEFTYLLVLVAIAILGPGRVSIDRLIEKKIDGQQS